MIEIDGGSVAQKLIHPHKNASGRILLHGSKHIVHHPLDKQMLIPNIQSLLESEAIPL